MNDTTSALLGNTNDQSAIISATSAIVAAALSNGLALDAVGSFMDTIMGKLSRTTPEVTAPVEKQEPAVSVRSSIKPDYLVCLEDGKKMKMLKRYLMTHYQMTPDQYRAKWSLPADYPMVAPNYAEQRRTLAKKIGLGTKRKGTGAAPEAAAPKRGRKAATADA